MSRVIQSLVQSSKKEGETEPLADKEVEALGRVEEPDQPMECIICFTKVVRLYQQKNRSCFRCGSPNHCMRDHPKDISKAAWKADLNTNEGMAKKGDQAPQKSASPEETP